MNEARERGTALTRSRAAKSLPRALRITERNLGPAGGRDAGGDARRRQDRPRSETSIAQRADRFQEESAFRGSERSRRRKGAR